MRKIGFTYGPAFQGLREISADPTGNEAVAIIDNNFEKSESFYELHPCTLDKLFQLMTVAQHEGISIPIRRNSVCPRTLMKSTSLVE